MGTYLSASTASATTSPPPHLHLHLHHHLNYTTNYTTTTTAMHRPSLSLDLSNLPPLSKPTQPTNTLLLTDLQNLPLFFSPASLDAIRATLSSLAPLNSFSPLPSLRRIICSFHTTDAALLVRKYLESYPLLASSFCRVYFGEPTPLLDEYYAQPRHLEAPHSEKLFFISPPPSPPHGWVMRAEDPPNKEVHASDLAQALTKLKTEQTASSAGVEASAVPLIMESIEPGTPMYISSDKRTGSWPAGHQQQQQRQQRSRSSTLIYHPEDHGGSPNLPAVMVEDMSVNLKVPSLSVKDEDDDEDEMMDIKISPVEASPSSGISVKKAPPKTARPPVELME